MEGTLFSMKQKAEKVLKLMGEIEFEIDKGGGKDEEFDIVLDMLWMWFKMKFMGGGG